jgi:16S rRNA (guanine527-N7)-methyltransferase
MNPEELLIKGLKELDIPVTEARISTFMAFLTELKKWNSAYNLTAIKTDNEIIIKHFLDSLLYLKLVPEGPLKIADAGSGAGFPGIPIKIIRPETDISLIESSRKKSAFLRHLIRTLKLPKVNVIEKRLEALCKKDIMDYDVLVSRATFRIKDLLKMTCPYLGEECLIVLSKGPGLSDELKELGEIPEYRNTVKKVLKLKLPLSESRRNLVLMKCWGKEAIY